MLDGWHDVTLGRTIGAKFVGDDALWREASRQSQCSRPAMEITTSSRCQMSRREGRLRRTSFA
jgi:hypothetical protein